MKDGFPRPHLEFAALFRRVSRWTYGVIMPMSLLYFPFRSGFRVHAVQCEWTFSLALAVYVMGFLVEIAEGATGIHHCRMRDLIPRYGRSMHRSARHHREPSVASGCAHFGVRLNRRRLRPRLQPWTNPSV